MIFRNAQLSDIENVLKLHFRYQVDSIKEEDKTDGFVTTPFTKEQMMSLIEDENGLFIALDGEEVVAYVMAASWQFWSIWPMFAYMIEDLPNQQYLGQTLSVDNSYQYGPVCIDKKWRGKGVLEQIFDHAREQMHKRFPILVTFINKNNPRSLRAHTKKLNLDILSEFEFNNNHYCALAYDTSVKLES
jgi:GNAT superfamily N-acetyltransferase